MDYRDYIPSAAPELVLVCEQEGQSDLTELVVNLESSGSDSEVDERPRIPGGRKRSGPSKLWTIDSVFVDLLSKVAPQLLHKSQAPSMKVKKAAGMKRLQTQLETCYGQKLSEKQIAKKIYNLKTRVRTKNQLNRTGDVKKMQLNETEQRFFELMKNPSAFEVTSTEALEMPSTSYTVNEESSSQEFNAPLPQSPQQPPQQNNEPKTSQNIQSKKSALIKKQEAMLEEQLNVLRTRDRLMKRHHAATMRQQQERHDAEMALLKCKREIAEHKLQMLKSNSSLVEVKKEEEIFIGGQ